MKDKKDMQFALEELTALCRNQKEYIKKLEEELKTPNCAEKCDESKPTYDELYRKIESLGKQVSTLEQENRALRYLLTKMYGKLEDSQAMAEIREEEYRKEHSRVKQLDNELNKNNKGESK